MARDTPIQARLPFGRHSDRPTSGLLLRVRVRPAPRQMILFSGKNTHKIDTRRRGGAERRAMAKSREGAAVQSPSLGTIRPVASTMTSARRRRLWKREITIKFTNG